VQTLNAFFVAQSSHPLCSRYFAATPVTVAVEHIPPTLLEHGAPRPEHLVLTLAERSRVLALDAVKLAAD